MVKEIIYILLFISSISSYAQSEEYLSPIKHFQKADQLFIKGNCEGALEHVNKTIAAQMNNWEAYQLRSRIYECLGLHEKAISDYSILILWQPDNPEFLFSRGILRYRIKHFQMALDDLKKSLLLPVSETNQVYFSTATGESGVSGIATIETLHSEMLNFIGLCHYELHHYDSAIIAFSQALEQKKDAKFFNNRALSLEAREEWAKAAQDYESALTLDENDEIAKYNLILVYGKMGELKKQKLLLNSLGTTKQLPEIHIYKGINAFNSGDYHLALAHYDTAIQMDDNKEEYYIYRGQAYEKLNDYEEAISDYEDALLLNQSYPTAYFSLGNTFYEMEELDSAKLCYDLAILYDEQYYKAYLNRAIVHLRNNKIEEACWDLSFARKGELKEAIKLYKQKCTGPPE